MIPSSETMAMPGVTRDAFLGGKVYVLQPEKGYRAGVDAVLLAAAVRGLGGASFRLLDCGAGVGTVGLSLAARLPEAHVTLLEAEAEYARLARENIALNDLGARVSIVEGRIGESAANHMVPREAFDVVVANPPFHGAGAGTPAANDLKAAAHAMPQAELEIWARFMAHSVKPGGEALLIHKADALGEILAAFESRFGAIAVLPIHSRTNEPAIRVLVSGIKGSRAPMRVLPGFVLHEAGHTFSPDAAKILRDGKALDWI
jgi:tRNA1(Val) A37 N6-methylase TrmN6